MNKEETEILEKLKKYMQDNIDSGYHKFMYNEYEEDKCIDIINAIDSAIKTEIKIPVRQYGKTYKQIKECENNLSNERIKNLKELLKNDMLNEKDINDLLAYIERLENITITYFKIICNGGME